MVSVSIVFVLRSALFPTISLPTHPLAAYEVTFSAPAPTAVTLGVPFHFLPPFHGDRALIGATPPARPALCTAPTSPAPLL
jgi:hypothetical protein